jgi:hypothetical protein
MIPPGWPPRDWRMMVALCLLAVAGAGAFILSWRSLTHMVRMSERLMQIWPLAYFAYGSLLLLGVPSLGFAMVVALKSFRVDLPGGSGFGATGGGDDPPAPIRDGDQVTVIKGDQ